MPVCRYFLQGSCRYGERCYNEHPREGRHQKRYEENYSDRSWQSNKYQEYDNQRSSYNQQSLYRDNSYKNQDYRNQHQSPMTRSNQHFGQNQSYQANRNSRDSDRTPNQDKYHWSRENRYAALESDKSPDTDIGTMLSVIKTDVQAWTESKMWPFSCYSLQKGVCIDGLPDISPEELRVLACLHPAEYANIVSEIEGNYCRMKDDLYQMNDATKSNIISQMHAVESNPSQNLKILALYGPQYNFGEKESNLVSKNEVAPSPQTPFSFKLSDQAPGFDSGNTSTAVPFKSVSISKTAEKTPNISVFGSSFTSKTSSQAPVSDDVYTNFDIMTDNEKKKFEAERFTIGEIPLRPPSENYCR